MVAGEEYAEALRQVVTHIEAIGNEIVDEYSGTTDDGQNVNGYWCMHGNNSYRVHAIEDDDLAYFRVIFPYDVLGDYSYKLAISESDKNPAEITDEDLDRQAANDDLNRRAGDSPQQYADLKENLMSILENTTPAAYEYTTTENGAVTGFEVKQKIYPISPTYSTKQYGDSVQRVVSIGLPARRFLRQAFGINELGSVSDSDEVDDEVDDGTFRHVV